MTAKEYLWDNQPHIGGPDDIVRIFEEYYKIRSKEDTENLIKAINDQCETYFLELGEHNTEPVYLKYDVLETIWNSTGKK